ncbi:hypothetical protein ASA1KI_45460 [Opitutales bacterium ASA1]|uniref:methyltransferase domain-containing protein n=1 Tax=Congregicoccus parvus TaxID=3081749 RepID=UPI002B304765|nr:hypothetical protein ASA1KI_45460 [Opitutales bacterium ASA1]
MTKATARCWCGNQDLLPFSDDYLRCAECETLVLARRPENLTSRIQDEDTELYGRNYYLRHLTEDYGYPDIESRMRADLPERCLHWLKTLLRYKSPGARTLELGCGHGASVALLRAAGYDATGLELSPWLVEFARKSWDIPVLAGPFEDQQIAPGSLDAVLAFDVLEHLPNPLATLSATVSSLAHDGVFLVQTPRYPEGKTIAELTAANHPFLEQFKPTEHLFLFSETAARLLMQRLGFVHVVFEPAIFAHYDQYFVAGRTEMSARSVDPLTRGEHATTARRLVQALLDASQHTDRSRTDDTLQDRLAAAESDRAARLRVIHEQGDKLAEVQKLVAATEADRDHWKDTAAKLALERDSLQEVVAEAAAQGRQLADSNSELQARLHAAENDRKARLDVIEGQGARLGDLQRLVAETETDRDHWRTEAERLAARVDSLQLLVAETETDRDHWRTEAERLAARVDSLQLLVAETEANRDYWRATSDDAQTELRRIRTEIVNLEQLLANASHRASASEEQLRVAETDRKARLVVIEEQGRRLAEVHALVAATETDRDYWRRQAENLAREIDHLRVETHRQIESLDSRLATAETDRAARLEVIHTQGAEIGRLLAGLEELRVDRDLWSERAATATQSLSRLQTELEQRSTRIADLEASLTEAHAQRTAHEHHASELLSQCTDLERRLQAGTAAGDLAHERLGRLLAWRARVQSHLLTRLLNALGLWPRL